MRRAIAVSIAVVVAVMVISAAILSLHRYDLVPEAPDDWIHDWRVVFGAKQAKEPNTEIVIVLVDERTIAKYPSRSPIDRRLLSTLVTAIDDAGAKAIGLDFIFERPSMHDALLADTLRAARSKIVLGKVGNEMDRLLPEQFAFQSKFLSHIGVQTGHLYFDKRVKLFELGDPAIRYRVPLVQISGLEVRSFAYELATDEKKITEPATRHFSWLLPPVSGGADLFPTLRVAMHEPGATAMEILPPFFEDVVKGRIVLIGTAFFDTDRHLIPLSVLDGQRYPGVFVHAQAVAQLRDGREILELADWVHFLGIAMFTLSGFIVARMTRNWLPSAQVLVASLGIMIIGVLGFLAFRYGQLFVPSATLFFGWGLGALAERLNILAVSSNDGKSTGECQ